MEYYQIDRWPAFIEAKANKRSGSQDKEGVSSITLHKQRGSFVGMRVTKANAREHGVFRPVLGYMQEG
ncbi:hypothetical protein [Peribacillus glennii]|uniref:Uncharacterized protein n=1 Tax=Peribacillus glennii TaxID=2303991 RepID=A0A372LHI5_9BACI|nr:hypothetical protein [Peribacillus glennii]RFU65775.1 hypothetical protein D0466_07850 [Peribacillus glennii]